MVQEINLRSTLSSLVLLCTLTFWASPSVAGQLMLKNGKVIQCKGEYTVKGNFVEYLDNHGNLYRLPKKIVDLKRSTQEDRPKDDKWPKVEKEKPKEKKEDLHAMLSGDDDLAKTRDKQARTITDRTLESYTVANPRSTADEWEVRNRMYRVYSAVDYGNLADLEDALIPGLPLNQPFDYYQIPVTHKATQRGYREMVQLLLRHGADVNLKDNNQETPLHIALRLNSPAHRLIAFDLLKAGADPNFKDVNKNRPIHLALQNRDAELLSALIKAGASTVVPNAFGDLPLISAINYNDPTSVQALLESGTPVHALNKAKLPALLVATQAGNTKIVKLLHDKGADVNLTSEGLSPLFIAVRNNDPHMSQLLLELGADPYLAPEKETPAELAVRMGHEMMLRSLLERGVDPNLPPLLPVAVGNGKTGLIELLLKNRAEVNGVDRNGNSALILASRAGNLALVQTLVDAGADVYLKSDRGYSAFLEADGAQKEEIKNLLRSKFKK